MDPVSAMNALEENLRAGGPDGRYTLKPTAENPNGFGDLRQFNLTQWFIGQAWHTTEVHHYNDTNDWTISPYSPSDQSQSIVRGFSISQIGGALGDSGQNYKNIYSVADAVFGSALADSSMVFGCGSKHRLA